LGRLIPSGLLDLSPFAFFACFVVNYYYPPWSMQIATRSAAPGLHIRSGFC
jgi:hypothetical protein